MMTIGFAGLGRMGNRMAANIARAGFPLVLYNRSLEKAATLGDALVAERHEVSFVATPHELCERAEVVVTMLADDAASRSVYDAFEPHMNGRLFCEMGTVSDACSRHHAERAHLHGARFVEAPVSGATEAAERGALLIMAGGAPEDIDSLRPVFATLGKAVVRVGPVGAGARMKLAVNMLIHGINQALAEALLLTELGGIGAAEAYEVIEQSAAAAPMIHYRKPLYLEEQKHPVAFALRLAFKDVDLALKLAASSGRDLPQSRVTSAILQQAIDAGFGERDMAAIAAYMRDEREWRR